MTGPTPRYRITGQSVGSIAMMAWSLGRWGIPILKMDGDHMVVESKIDVTTLALAGCSVEEVPK